MKIPLRGPLKTISEKRIAQARGFAFQDWLCDFLVGAKFEIERNPKAARPRQTDVYATYDDDEYLIEAKWQSKKIDTSDIDDLRARLDRVHPGIIGCIFSMSDYTRNAIEAVESNRNRQILLFNPAEVRFLSEADWELPELIKRKRKKLTIDGRVWFSDRVREENLPSKFIFPAPSQMLRQNGMEVPAFATGNSEINEVVFAAYIPDIYTGVLSGKGVGITLSLEIQTLSEAKRFLALMHNLLGFTANGSFTIRQLACSWHGFGVDNLLDEAARWKERYAEVKLNHVQHSEDLSYFDSCDTGYCLFTARQRVGHSECLLHSCALEIHLAGIPLRIKPFERICEEARAMSPYFVPFDDTRLDHARFKKPIDVQPKGHIISSRGGQQSVNGIIVKNPFKKKRLIPTGRIEHSPFHYLGTTDDLICMLSDWHNVEDEIDQYHMTRLEGVQIGDTLIYRCVGTWKKIIGKKTSRK